MRFFKKEDLLIYLKSIFALLITFWFLGFVEIIANYNSDNTITSVLQSVSYKILNNFITTVIIALLFYPIYIIINLKDKKYGKYFFIILGILLVLIELSLVKYSLKTLLNLGADLLGYSFDDMFITVSSSSSFSILDFVALLLFPLLFVVIRHFLVKKMSDKLIMGFVIFLAVITIPFKFLVEEFGEDKYQNKINFLVSDIIGSKLNSIDSYEVTAINEFPLLKPSEEIKDVLQPFFNIQPNKKPNIVIVSLEGLGNEFVDGNEYSGFSPFIDKLIKKSLYWENFVSTTGRTFGVLPSLLGSLPFGETGFLEIENLPTHVSLFSILKENDYTTSFYSGSQSSFDNIISFLEYHNVDHVIDENKYGEGYKKAQGSEGGFSWGYPDAELFKKTLSTLDDKKNPRLDVIMTISNHDPFAIPEMDKYRAKIDSILKSNKKIKLSESEVNKHKDIYATHLYADESVEKFMKGYEKRADYNNTIFIFTGDHRIIPIAQKDKLCRYHVPLIIYSPMLKKPVRFKSVSSHWDVVPSLMSFLSNNYPIQNIEKTAWMGTGLDTTRSFRNTKKIGLMRYKGGLKDFMYKDYLYNEGDLYKIDESFNTKKVYDNDVKKTIEEEFLKFKQINSYVTKQNKIYPVSARSKMQAKKIEFTEEELSYIKETLGDKTFEKLFLIAREKAFNNQREKARLLCNYILNAYPNYTDARILKGRTLAWDGSYKEAEKEFLSAIKRSPFYDDPYLAILDLYWWSSQDEKGVEIGKKALKNNIKNPIISFKLAKAYDRLNKKAAAIKILDSLIKIHPKNKEFKAYRKGLK